MAVHSRKGSHDVQLDLSSLSLELAKMDPVDADSLGAGIVAAIASALHIDRVSLALFHPRSGDVIQAYYTGFDIPVEQWDKPGKVLAQVRSERAPLLVHNIREQPALVSARADTYRTDSCAVFPLTYNRRVIGALCLSNLCTKHVLQLENADSQLDLIIAQLKQMAAVLYNRVTASQEPHPAQIVSAGKATPDELTLLSSLIEKLDRTLDARNMFAVFAELISTHLPFEMLAVIHDSMLERQSAVVCLQRPVHQTEVKSIFNTLSHQWQARHRRAPGLELDEAQLLNSELMQLEGVCPEELRLNHTETIPIFIDNDLFGLVCLAADEKVLNDKRLVRLFAILSHSLLLHVKKSLLLAQNQEMQTVDALTGLYNERHFYQMMEREFDRASRYNVPLSLLFIDADHFKDVNETYGFETGDLLLQEISRIIMQNMRTTDFVSRYGGERFVVVLPETHYKNSEIMANRLRRFIENNSFFIPNTNVFVKVTVSIGVASYLEHKPASLAQFIEFADMALYFAKLNGRNQAVGYSYVINLMMGSSESQS